MIRSSLMLVFVSVVIATMSAQSPDATARFEIASIKPTRIGAGAWPADPGEETTWLWIARSWDSPARRGRFAERLLPALALVQMAYNVWSHQIQGLPDWARSARFDIDLRAGDQVPLPPMRLMLRTLLAERFKLVVRQETRTSGVFELVPAAGGIKFAATKKGDCIILGPDSPPPPLSLPPAPMPNICGWTRNSTLRQTFPRIVRIEGAGVPMSDLIRRLQPELGRIIIDRTGFTETFSFSMAFVPNDLSGGAGAVTNPEPGAPSDVQESAVSIGTALREQLGLELRSAQGEVDVLIIERIDRPTEN